MTNDELKMSQMIEESIMCPIESLKSKAKVKNPQKTVRRLRRFECIIDEDKPSVLYVPKEIDKIIPPGFVTIRCKEEL